MQKWDFKTRKLFVNKIMDIQTSEVDVELAPVVGRGHEILYADRSWKDEQILIR
jgi:hypothetical protein